MATQERPEMIVEPGTPREQSSQYPTRPATPPAIRHIPPSVEGVEQRREILKQILEQKTASLNVSIQGWNNRTESGSQGGHGPGFSPIIKAGAKIAPLLEIEHYFGSIHHRNPESESKMVEQLMFEEVRLRPIMKDNFTDVPVVRERIVSGFLGIFKKVEKYQGTERKKVGRSPVLHSEVQANGSTEPAVFIIYRTVFRAPYKDYTGRSGNYMEVAIAVPSSLGVLTLEHIRKDPQFAREIAKEFAMSLGMSSEQWESGDAEVGAARVCPPYKLWAQNGSKMLIGGTAESEDQVVSMAAV
ncbi:hypothetical protein HZA86_04145 [Candidatus Uhrbacteria bacterium]|nr:hypothetical protein [Candidatus Uhrbacteria bacterium]